MTLGYFDITLGSGLEEDPDADHLPAANRGILLDPEKMTIQFYFLRGKD